ncbi:hypothetical protein [Actinomadura fibrosa]|uniref:Uncharacterized protein n=1 Tax=Actinomadura fibrosa TaxID=111802 RepID=A0ABW2Y3L4_9ACTN|nr:hypothetical protein [Actinomadura fibrosa]
MQVGSTPCDVRVELPWLIDQATKTIPVVGGWLWFAIADPHPGPAALGHNWSFAAILVGMAVRGVRGPLEGTDRSHWTVIPFVHVGPLRFGMAHDDVVAALGGVEGHVGAEDVGLVMRAQRTADMLLTRPVFVARE